MGVCSSIPSNDWPASARPRQVFPTKPYKTTAKKSLFSSSFQSDGSKCIGVHSHQKGSMHTATEACENTPNSTLHNTGAPREWIEKCKGNNGSWSRWRKVPRTLRVGYSSGGSSAILNNIDPGGHRRSLSGCHLAEIKNSISVEGDLCKGVVRIETDFGRPIEEMYEGVHDGPVLGSGVSGVVRRVKHRMTGVEYAAKCLELGLIHDAAKLQALREEITIMCQLDHPNIIRLEEVYENEHAIFLIQELCSGGDLFDRLDKEHEFHYTEFKCAQLVKQMLSAVRYLHSKSIVHRDLKLENFVFSTPTADSELRMIDFGLSKHFSDGVPNSEPVGTPYTVAPEVLQGRYDEKVDLWALGVITYLLLSGRTPFGGCDGESLISVKRRILMGRCSFEPEEAWENVSDQAKAFIRRLLNPNSENRPTAKEAQSDPWLQEFGRDDCKRGKSLSPRLCRALVEFKEYSEMHKLLCEILSFTMLPEQILGLREEFERVDIEGDSEISFAALKQVLKDSAEDGALTENDVERIFDALRVRKTETKFRWHEFIAAGLSQCNFDERNLRLAFDRLDYDRKGYITIEDMKGLLGSNEVDDDPAIRQMWDEGLKECACPLGRITYDDFCRFIMGKVRGTYQSQAQANVSESTKG